MGIYEYEYVTDFERLGAIANELSGCETLPLDLETTGLDPLTSQIRILSINTGKHVYVIDALRCGSLKPVIQALIDHPDIILVGQNLKFDCKFLKHHYGYEPKRLFDTFRASAILYNGQGKGRRGIGHNLYDLYARELNVYPKAKDLGGSDWGHEITEEQTDYAAEDVIYLPQLRDVLKPKLAKAGLNMIAGIEFQAIAPEVAIELAGFFLDQGMWLENAKKAAETAARLRIELLTELPNPKRQMSLPGFTPNFNLDSSKQMLESLHMAGIKVENTNEKTLAMVAGKYPILSKVIEYRGISKNVTAFGPGYLRHCHPVDGRIHTQFYPFTGAGRFSSGNPNLQQIPRDKKYRACFRAAPGKVLILADYSQIELRMVAELSKEPAMIAAYLAGEDLHNKTARLILNLGANDKVEKAQRQCAKAVNFGFVYGMGAKTFVIYAQSNYGVTLTLSQAERFHRKYFEAYPRLRYWHRCAVEEGQRNGYSKTILGRIRYLEEDLYSEYMNSPSQGSAADGLKRALKLVHEKLRKYGGRARMVHMVHDEIIIEADNDPELIALCRLDLESGMVGGMSGIITRMPVLAESSFGASWADKA